MYRNSNPCLRAYMHIYIYIHIRIYMQRPIHMSSVLYGLLIFLLTFDFFAPHLHLFGISNDFWFVIFILDIRCVLSPPDVETTAFSSKSSSSSGWCCGTFFIFPYIGNVIIPTDEPIFFRGVGFNHQPVTIMTMTIESSLSWSDDSHHRFLDHLWGYTTYPYTFPL